jgi:hypothetical protein
MKFLGLLLFIVFLIWLADGIRDRIKNEVTVYSIFEDEKGRSIPLNRQVYKAFPETQTVIYWFPGIEEVPGKLAKCTVRDRLNWKCEYKDGSGKVIMEDGRFQELDPHNRPFKDTIYVGQIRWWMIGFGFN